MNFKKLFVSFIAAAAALVACTQEEDFGLPKIEVNPAELSFNVGEGSQEVEILSTRDWLVQTCPEWVAVSVKGGPASSQKQKVTISVNANPSFTRTEDVVFTIGVKKCALTIRQDGEKGELRLGSGTLEDPFTVGGVFKYVKDLGADVVSPDAVYVKGIVSSIAQDSDTFTGSGTYGNATFKISDDGKDTGDQFYCYRILYLGNRKFKSGDTDVKVGDEVIICGKVVNYKGNTPETNQGSSFLYSLNGKSEGGAPATTGDPKGSGSKDDPFNVAGAIKAVSNLSWTSNDNYQKVGPYYVKGKVSKLGEQTFSNSGTYGNASFYITDDGVGNEFYCYRVLYLGNVKYTSGDDVKVGDEVIICGELMNYRGNTPETVASSAYLYSLNGKTAGGGDTPSGTGDPKGTGAKDDPFNVSGAIKAVSNLSWTSNDNYEKVGPYYVKGIISNIAKDADTFTGSGTYGNATFKISDDGKDTGDQFYCYRILYLGNVKYTSGDDVKVGDEVIICGELMNYRGNTPETVSGSAYLYSLNGKTEGGGDTPGDTPGGDVKNPNVVTVAEFLAAPESNDQPYKLTGTIGNVANTTYGNFDLTDSTGSVYVYGLTATNLGYGARNDQSYSSLGLSEGAVITLIGFRGSFNEKPEVMYAYLVEVVSGGNGGDTPGDTPGGESGDFSSNVTMKKGTSCYDDNKLNVNGVSGVANLKFGTSKVYGNGTVVLPAGTKEVTFYAIAWKGADASLKMTMGSSTMSFDVKANDGASGNAPYNVTVTDSDKYSVKFDSPLAAETEVKVETYEGNKKGFRAFIFGVQAK